MAARKQKNEPAVPVRLRDQLNIVVCVCATLVDALSVEDHEDYATTLLECAVLPLRRIREELERL